jgi:hypothetical protein
VLASGTLPNSFATETVTFDDPCAAACDAIDCAGSWSAWADDGNGGTTCADWKPAEQTRQYTVTAEAVCGGSTANCVDAGDTCRWANDGACDVPSYCAAGTDDTDCGTPPTETQSGYDGPASCPIPETVCTAARICLIFYLQFTMQYMYLTHVLGCSAATTSSTYRCFASPSNCI